MKTIYLIMKICVIATVLCSVSDASAAMGINVASAGKVTGKIHLSLQESTPGNLTVSLFSTADSTLIAGTLTDATGNFSFCMLGNGEYFVEIGNPGYKTIKIDGVYIHSANSAIDLGEIEFTHYRHQKRRKK
jgi:hypothetical protein